MLCLKLVLMDFNIGDIDEVFDMASLFIAFEKYPFWHSLPYITVTHMSPYFKNIDSLSSFKSYLIFPF